MKGTRCTLYRYVGRLKMIIQVQLMYSYAGVLDVFLPS